MARVEEIRVSIEKLPVWSDSLETHPTASFGVASFPLHGKTEDPLLSAADTALYEAKTAHINVVIQTRPA